MENRRIGAVGAVVTVLTIAASTVPGWLLERATDGWLQGGGSAPLSQFGTLGQTVLVYNYAVGALEQFLPLAFGVGLGVWLTRRVAAEELPAALRAVAVGSGAVVAVAALPLVVAWGSSGLGGIAMLLALTAELAVAGPLQVTVAAAGGIALSQFGLLGGDSSGPTSTGSEAASTATAEPVDEERSTDSVP